MKKEKVLKLDAFGIGGILVLILILVFFVIVIYLSSNQELILVGDPADEFCEQKCYEKGLGDLTYSVNSSEYGVIECECVIKEIHREGKYQPVVKIETRDFYFDSKTLEKITLEEVKSRLR